MSGAVELVVRGTAVLVVVVGSVGPVVFGTAAPASCRGGNEFQKKI